MHRTLPILAAMLAISTPAFAQGTRAFCNDRVTIRIDAPRESPLTSGDRPGEGGPRTVTLLYSGEVVNTRNRPTRVTIAVSGLANTSGALAPIDVAPEGRVSGRTLVSYSGSPISIPQVASVLANLRVTCT